MRPKTDREQTLESIEYVITVRGVARAAFRDAVDALRFYDAMLAAGQLYTFFRLWNQDEQRFEHASLAQMGILRDSVRENARTK